MTMTKLGVPCAEERRVSRTHSQIERGRFVAGDVVG